MYSLEEFVLFTYSSEQFFSQETKSPSKEAAALILRNATAISFEKMFDYAPIDKKSIFELASRDFPSVKTIGDAAKAFSSIKPKELESRLTPFVTEKLSEEEFIEKKRGNPVQFAQSFYLKCVCRNLYQMPQITYAPPTKERLIKLVANYCGWQVVKKVDLLKAEKKEVLACLAGIYSVSLKKSSEFFSKDFSGFQNYLDSFLSKFSPRKSFSKASEILSSIEETKFSKDLLSFFEPSNAFIGKEFFLNSCFEYSGVTPFVSIDSINEVYPELKIPKPKGRIKK